MCGIAGIWTKSALGTQQLEKFQGVLPYIRRRGPDFEDLRVFEKAGMAHTRLSIIDTTAASHQPMSDTSGRYTLVFNGEIYNYKSLAEELNRSYGAVFNTTGDTEVLLQGLIYEGADFLSKINGFFSFAFYDIAMHEMLLARDRFGIKPLYYAAVEGGWAFGSNLSACIQLGASGIIDTKSLTQYLQLSYIPAPASILKDTFKCLPGNTIRISDRGFDTMPYYKLPEDGEGEIHEDQNPAKALRSLLEASVEKRLMADVPVGTFLSGGLDSSIISLIAAKAKPTISAFSIGFPDQPFFDESAHARAVAKQIGIEHHVLEIREKEIEAALHGILDGIDEPFADSSAILVNLLSAYTRKEVKVALSGDGADELLGGYNKHRALYRSAGNGLINTAMKQGGRILEILPASRSHKVFNKLRKAQRYSRGLQLDFSERYWSWACFSERNSIEQILKSEMQNFERTPFVENLLQGLKESNFNTVLKADFGLVLPNDMLHKVDSMSMQHGLEVRVPFLDHNLVNAVFSMQAHHKLDKVQGKKMLRQAFEKDFAPGTFNRSKKGFEAPLRLWFESVLQPLLKLYCAPEYLRKQGIFDPDGVAQLRQKVASKNSGDAPHTLWAILVFQHWWHRHRAVLSLD